ncbi:lysine-specific demethylase 5-like isoform X2 [Brevipalpus obovatus]|uniref:lysine-specific demethylase 5-like isoform X2 n=1 Tax=Brevipalpus obovatus TaxID=246614 RepID=UPI003D9ED5E7
MSSFHLNHNRDPMDFNFVPPPEAPVFRPNDEDFMKGPLEYIRKIRPFAEKHGICRIIPPPSFQPPFAVDVEQFRFTPRVQRLHELEAQTRVKLNFLEQVIKYWDLQGAPFKLPTVEKKVLDLYTLHKVVAEEGGFESCTRERKWSKVAHRMNFHLSPQNKGTVSSLLRQHYERILYPFDVFLSGATIGGDPKIPGVKIDFNHNTNSNSSNSLSSSNLSQFDDSNSKDATNQSGIEIKQEKSMDDSSSSNQGVSNTSSINAEGAKNSPILSVNSPTSHQRLYNKHEKPETKPTRSSPRRIERPITYNVNIDINKQLKLVRREQPQNCTPQAPASVPATASAPSSTPSSVHKNVDLNEDEATDCDEETKEDSKCEEESDSIQLRPSPRRQTRRMQSRTRRRTSFLRVDKVCAKSYTESYSILYSELQRLQVYGAGPKMPGFSTDSESKVKSPDKNSDFKDQSQICILCNEDTFAHQLLRCAGCGNLFHLYCLIPPRNDMPKGVWHCPRCVALFVQSHPQPFTHEFGFVQSQRDYSLAEFGEMADRFKAQYFGSAPHVVPLAKVEREFWRLVSSMDDTVTVEYGADLHTNDFGSGFPTKKSKCAHPSDLEYIDHPWNLNNLPILEGSVFKYINSNISGMIVPWIYVGMCFSTFCWHNEDHWSYSINYLHWGEPKTWYGVPGDAAEKFEDAMKRAAPELFETQPDLLHQLVTICNPNILMDAGVPIYRTNQRAGEFVVTFPRAYHAGFNQGLNLAEAVNFAPSEWLSIGRSCVDHYAMLQRYPVFSHDELICKMANIANELDIAIATATCSDMLAMLEREKKLWAELDEWGVIKKEQVRFELLPDDERQCEYCKTTCFLSSVSCECYSDKYVCLPDKDKLCKKCSPSQHIFKFRFTGDEFPVMVDALKSRVQDYDEWSKRVSRVLLGETEDMVLPSAVQSLAEEAKTKSYPTNTKIYEQLETLIKDMVEEHARLSKRLINPEHTPKRENIILKKPMKVDILRRQSSNNYSNDLDLASGDLHCMVQNKKLRRNV